MSKDIYANVTDRIVTALEAGTVPWQKPWRAGTGRPVSMSTRKPYRGVNVMLLALTATEAGHSSRWWGTYKQISELGGQVRKGERSTEVVFFKQLDVAEKDASGRDVTKRIPLLRSFRVFNAEQADGLPERFYPEPEEEAAPLPQPQDALDAYLTACGPQLRHVEGDAAHYQPGPDLITLPLRSQFRSPEQYYATAFHEATHSTGHRSRLARPGIGEFDHFGSERYAKEELAAQIGSAMLCAETGLESPDLAANDAAYVANWLTALKDDRKLVVSAASQAERAAELVMEPSRQPQAVPESAELEGAA